MVLFQKLPAAHAAVAACGVLGLVAALLMQPDLVATYLAKDGHIELVTARGLSVLRTIVFVLSLATIAATFFLERIKHHYKIVILLLPFIGLLAILSFKLSMGVDNGIYMWLVAEDSIVEYATFACFLFAAFIAGYVGVQSLKNRYYLGGTFQAFLGLFCLIVALEEISYGQRIFGFETPQQLQEVNDQDEFNFHNISGMGTVMAMITWYLSYPAVLTFGLFGWLGRHIANLLSLKPLQDPLTADLLFPPWYITTYFVPLVITTAQLEYVLFEPGTVIISRDQEPAELFLGLGFLLFVLAAFQTCRRSLPVGKRQTAATTIPAYRTPASGRS